MIVLLQTMHLESLIHMALRPRSTPHLLNDHIHS